MDVHPNLEETDCGWGLCITISITINYKLMNEYPKTNMTKDSKEKLRYKVRTFRLSDKTYKTLIGQRKKLGKSWNLYFMKISGKKLSTEKLEIE